MVAPVHLEHLGTIETVAAMKAELIEGLKPGGVAVLNADDKLVMEMKSKTKGPVLTFGMQKPADVTATEIDSSKFGSIRFRLKTPLGEAAAELPMTGAHNLMNSLAASAVATALKVRPELIADALRSAKPPKMRGEVLNFAAGFTVVDDSYNSKPRSLLSMVRTLTEARDQVTRRIVIAGEMLEPARSRHRRCIVRRATRCRVWELIYRGSARVRGRFDSLPARMTRIFSHPIL
jgi:UDP-N-acetylmuramoyl-tripeptide--D-alanyl-D-alanine ligase